MAAGERPFGFWTASALVVGGMVGAGIFVLPGQLAPYGWTGLAAWIAGAAGALVLARILAGLTAHHGHDEGVIAACGEVLGPLPGVLIGWGYWVSIWSAVAVIALTGVQYLSAFWPPLAASPMRLALEASGLVILMTLLNLRGARAAGLFQLAVGIPKLLPLIAVALILIGLVTTGGGAAFAVHDHVPLDAGQLTPALSLAFFALIGFEAASVAAERVVDPGRNVLRASMAGLTLTALLYLIVCTGIVMALPADKLEAAPAPFALFVETYWGSGAGLAIAAFAAIAAIGALNCWVLIQGEVPLSMARAGLLPRWMAHTNERDVATGPLILSSALACALLLSSATRFGAQVLDFMMLLTTTSTILLYGGACLAALCAGLMRPLALIGLAFSAWVFYGAGIEPALLSLVLMATAVPLYLLASRAAPQPAE